MIHIKANQSQGRTDIFPSPSSSNVSPWSSGSNWMRSNSCLSRPKGEENEKEEEEEWWAEKKSPFHLGKCLHSAFFSLCVLHYCKRCCLCASYVILLSRASRTQAGPADLSDIICPSVVPWPYPWEVSVSLSHSNSMVAISKWKLTEIGNAKSTITTGRS